MFTIIKEDAADGRMEYKIKQNNSLIEEVKTSIEGSGYTFEGLILDKCTFMVLWALVRREADGHLFVAKVYKINYIKNKFGSTTRSFTHINNIINEEVYTNKMISLECPAIPNMESVVVVKKEGVIFYDNIINDNWLDVPIEDIKYVVTIQQDTVTGFTSMSDIEYSPMKSLFLFKKLSQTLISLGQILKNFPDNNILNLRRVHNNMITLQDVGIDQHGNICIFNAFIEQCTTSFGDCFKKETELISNPNDPKLCFVAPEVIAAMNGERGDLLIDAMLAYLFGYCMFVHIFGKYAIFPNLREDGLAYGRKGPIPDDLWSEYEDKRALIWQELDPKLKSLLGGLPNTYPIKDDPIFNRMGGIVPGTGIAGLFEHRLLNSDPGSRLLLLNASERIHDIIIKKRLPYLVTIKCYFKYGNIPTSIIGKFYKIRALLYSSHVLSFI